MTNIKKIFTLSLVFLSFLFTVNLKAQSDIFSIFSDNSVLDDYNIPTSLQTGQVYSVSVTMRNIGLNTWKRNENYRLALYDSRDNAYASDVWGIQSVSLPQDVSPSERVTFIFQIRAPNTSGIYNSRWRMAKDNEFFGESTPVSVNVNGEGVSSNAHDDASYENVSVPTDMMSGQKYGISITMRNNGRSTWIPYEYKLSPVSDSYDRTYMDGGLGSVAVNQKVEPGQLYTFSFNITAPSPGNYSFQWMMMRGNTYFGERTKDIVVNVNGYGSGTTDYALNSASFVSHSIPANMKPHKKYNVTIIMANNGRSTWTKGRHYLVPVDPRMLPVSLNQWSLGSIEVPETVPPGSSATFRFQVRAPSEQGNYSLQLSMMENGTFFGSPTSPIQINVSKMNKGKNKDKGKSKDKDKDDDDDDD